MSTFKMILFNNSKVFLMLTLGILTCGILSVVFSLLMGGMIGLLVKAAWGQGGTAGLILATLIPHGVLELAAFMSLAALGIYFAVRVYKAVDGHPVDWVAEAKLYGLFGLAAYVVVFLAALIETFVTPTIAARFIGS